MNKNKFDDLGLVILQITNDITEAQLIKGKLELQEIPVILKGESIGGAYAITVNGWGQIKVLVKKEDLEKAKEVLDNEKE